MTLPLDQIKAFASYNRRFNERLFATAAKLSDEERKRARGAFFGSIHGTLNHLLLADRIWLERFRKAGLGSEALEEATLVSSFGSLTDELYADFATLRVERTATDAVIERWSDALTPAALAGTFRYTNSQGAVREHAAWIAVAHLFNHETHHRGQVTTLLFQAGLDPGVTDFLAFALAPTL